MKVRLTETRLALVTDYGLTTNTTGRVAAIIGTVLVALIIIGSFSIDGRTRRPLNEVVEKNVVIAINSSEEAVDYRDHVSEDGKRVSGTFILTREAATCVDIEGEISTWYSSVNNLRDIDSVTFDGRLFPINSTCRRKSEGYDNQESFKTRFLRGREIEESRKCRYIIGEQEPGSKLSKTTATLSSCDMEIFETWCAHYSGFVCISQARTFDGGYFMIYNVGESAWYANRIFFDHYVFEHPFPTNAVRSAAYLFATGAEHEPVLLHVITRSTVKVDSFVPLLSECVQETNINLALLLGTAGTALFVTAVVAVAAFFSYWRDIVAPGRHDCNRFNSATDAMLCAASAALDGDIDGLVQTGVFIGVSREEPHVGPLRKEEMDDLKSGGGLFFEEELLRGRRRLS